MSTEYLQVRGRIFDIQKFSVHDGPGIRTIIFFKGCVLRCRWCCNPESQRYEIETMVVDGKEKVIGLDVTVEEVLEEIAKDRIFYRRSGGGVTLSGGEALCQPEFGSALLRACKEKGYHTAMESMGCAPFETLERYLPNLDLYLMDIKHTDPEKHKLFTGRSNELMLENARKIAKSNTELIIRVPVIPGFNDLPSEIRSIAEYAASLPGVEQMHLLPYHRLGQDKYRGLGREYLMGDLMPPTNEQMQRLLEEVVKTGLRGQIGG
ncbi:MAG: glycyl-radical enzyme activating protein [Lachnospiraceae bacterium]|nr:glycyl-radical enzyme activating protein [Lachnospiraceae bacterium]